MKYAMCTFLLMIVSTLLTAQAPPSFTYQAVLRDNAGNPIESEEVTLDIAILQGSADGTQVFHETHHTATNDFGLVNVEIGSIESLEGIPWGEDTFYVEISVDGVFMGTSQLLSVPYALHATTSADTFSGDYDDLEGLPDLSGFIAIEDPETGDLVYYGPEGWQSLPIGEEGQILQVKDGTIKWSDLYFAVEFVVEDQDGQPVTDAVVTLNGTTNDPGDYIFNVLAGSYSYTVEAPGYYTYEGQVEVLDEDITVSIVLEEIAHFSVTFHVEDEHGDPVTDAVITLGEVENSPGDYQFDDVSAGEYPYSVEATGYEMFEGQVEVTDQDVTENVILLFERYSVTFNVEDTYGDPVTDAVITLNGIENDPGDYVFEDVIAGVYDYSVEATGFETLSGQVEVTDQNVTVDVTLEPEEIDYYTVTFVVEDEAGDPVTDAVITFNGIENNPGDYVFEDVAPGEYNYAVSADDYETYVGQVEVIDQDVTETVVLEFETDPDTVTDADGNEYQIISIGDQQWLASDLRVTVYNDGTDIPALADDDWEDTGDGAYALYPHDQIEGIDSDAEMADAYGKLYNWYAVNHDAGLCPAGWRPATQDDWSDLKSFIADDGHAGQQGNALKAARQVGHPWGGEHDTEDHPRWPEHSVQYGIDEYGFSAFPGGMRTSAGIFAGMGNHNYIWTGTEESDSNAVLNAILSGTSTVMELNMDKNTGLSVRCIKDNDDQ